MKHLDAFKRIEQLTEAYFDIWERVCDIESPTNHKEGVDSVGRFFIEIAKERGWKVEICPQNVSGDVVCITMNSEVDKKPLCISGHIDTVHPLGRFGEKPTHRDNEKIYGPGVTDCKGGIVAGMLCMEALKNCGFASRPVMLLLQTDEEMSSKPSKKATINYICEKSKDAVAFLNLEGFTHGKCKVARKGILTLEFKVKGIKAHSSACAKSGANAIAEAAYKIIEMEKLKDDDGLTCNCGVISGGTVVNTVPDECVFRANIRFATQEQYDYVMDYAKKVAEQTHVEGCSCSVYEVGYRPAMEKCRRNYDLLDTINRIYAENNLPVLEEFFARGGSDTAYTTISGIPSVDGMGVEGDCIHSQDEWAYIKSLKESADRIGAVIFCI